MEASARRFAADVSHELRTPVATMVAVSDVLDDSADTLQPDTSRAARLVTTEADRLARLVDDLMEISRFDAGANTLIAYEIDVAEAVRACLRARDWQDKVSTDLPDPPPPPLRSANVDGGHEWNGRVMTEYRHRIFYRR